MAPSGSRVISSTQPSEPGALNSPAPGKVPACHSWNTAPPGSAATANRPTSNTSIGPSSSVPPASVTARAVSSASVTANDTFQATGCDGWYSGASAATAASPRCATV
jgi:hypothetical protein